MKEKKTKSKKKKSVEMDNADTKVPLETELDEDLNVGEETVEEIVLEEEK